MCISVFQPTGPARFAGILLLLGGLFATPLPADAQDDPSFGFALGVNLATLRAPAAETGVRQLFTAGAVARMGLVSRLSIQGELMFAQKGAAVEDNGEAIRYGAGYIDLPLLLRVEGPQVGGVRLYALAGGFGGLKVFERQRAGGDLSLPLPDAGTSFFRRTNAGALGGIGGTVPIGGGRGLKLLVRYSHGLVDVARPVDTQPFSVPFPPEARTRTVSILLLLGL
jgi:hypothetical protein